MAEMTWHSGDLDIGMRTGERSAGRDLTLVWFTVTSGAFSATHGCYLSAKGIIRFADRVHHLWETLTGEAELGGDLYDGGASLGLVMCPRGHVDIEVRVRAYDWGRGEIRLDVTGRTDQTYLPALCDGLRSLL